MVVDHGSGPSAGGGGGDDDDGEDGGDGGDGAVELESGNDGGGRGKGEGGERGEWEAVPMPARALSTGLAPRRARRRFGARDRGRRIDRRAGWDGERESEEQKRKKTTRCKG